MICFRDMLSALSAMRHAEICGGPCWNRTNDSLLKRQILYLTELTAL